jgi:murein tripeptide amidase MpaA
MLSITERSSDPEESSKRPIIIVSARVHPGETISSYMMHGFLDFILSDVVEAKLLRKAFVFKVIPMLNPDGVIEGNYRCSLAGCDLNRRYIDTDNLLHPTIAALKDMISSLQSQKREILFIFDLHGHSKNKNVFFYGCDVLLQSERQLKSSLQMFSPEEVQNQQVFSRLFPKILSNISNS